MLRAWIAATVARLDGALPGVDWQSGRTLMGSIVERGFDRALAAIAAAPDAWISVEALVRWMRVHHFGFLALAHEDPFAVYDLGSALYHVSYGGAAAPDPWEQTEGRVIRDSLTSALATLGVVDLAGAGAGLAFRVTAPGRALLAAFADPTTRPRCWRRWSRRRRPVGLSSSPTSRSSPWAMCPTRRCSPSAKSPSWCAPSRWWSSS